MIYSLNFMYFFTKTCKFKINLYFLDRTWICEICSKISNSYKAHWKHRSTHKLLDFSCEFCEFQSTTRKALNSHEREVHGLVSFSLHIFFLNDFYFWRKNIGYSPFHDNASLWPFLRIFTVAFLLFLAPAGPIALLNLKLSIKRYCENTMKRPLRGVVTKGTIPEISTFWFYYNVNWRIHPNYRVRKLRKTTRHNIFSKIPCSIWLKNNT